MRIRPGYSECHPKRCAVPGTDRCRICVGIAATPEDRRPALVVGQVQRGGPTIPPACPKCSAPWAAITSEEARCLPCGTVWHRTSERLIPPPREMREQDAILRQLAGRPDRGLRRRGVSQQRG